MPAVAATPAPPYRPASTLPHKPKRDVRSVLRAYVRTHEHLICGTDEAERRVQSELARIWKARDERDEAQQPSLRTIPRLHLRKPLASTPEQASVYAAVGKMACTRVREQIASLVLDAAELEDIWSLLKENLSPPISLADERINYDDFTQVAAQIPPGAASAFFCATSFLKFPLDEYGRLSILHFYQWVRCKNAILRTRVELSWYDSKGDGTLTERELEMWVSDVLPQLPSLANMQKEFLPFYKVTAVRKFFFFLDPRRRGRVPIRDVLASPILHELLELRRDDLSPDDLANNWFALDHAEVLYQDYLDLDNDQNGLLSVAELSRFRDGGLTLPFVQRIFQEVHTYRVQGQNEIDYKSYLDFVLAMTPCYKGSPEAIGYFFRLLDLRRVGKLSAFEVSFFFRAVVEKIAQEGEDAGCTVADVTGEIFDMVKPAHPLYITLHDLVNCKVGDTVVGILTDMHSFWQYERREQYNGHDEGEGDQQK